MMFVLVMFLLCMRSFVMGVLTLGIEEDAGMTNTQSCIEKERQALLDFKADLVDEHNSLKDWGSKENESDCCKWQGVRCDNHTGHVIGIDLSSFYGLAGKISPSLSKLNQLQYLNLSEIDFQSNPIPNFLGSLTNLQHLDLSNANLSGPIPHQLGNLSNLLRLDLSCNFLVGSIPISFGDLTSLTYLDLSGNQLGGVIPKSFGNCSSLVQLNLSENDLEGNFPDFTGCLSLQSLDLSSNRLNGTLPKSVGSLSKLKNLDVSSNSLNGLISIVHFLNLTQLIDLDLSFNSFVLDLSSRGGIPFQLKTIKLQSCKLGPHFPIWLKTQRKFTHLDISSAGISDSIPEWFWNLPPALKFLNISSNEIMGTLPNMTNNFNGYPGIDLSQNHLDGRVPRLPSKLAALNLSGNKFSGTLSFLCQIDAYLTFLDLSNNLLSGSLPDCLSKFREKLVVLNLSQNSLSGEIPSSFGFLSQLEALYLRENAFVGELPMSLSNCTKLMFVDLGKNNLSGNIPAWIGESLQKLYVLVLQSNRFNGSLPSQICWLKNLQFLDLSWNELSGSIPQCVGNFTGMVRRGFLDEITNHSYYSYLGNFPPHKCCSHARYDIGNRGCTARYCSFSGLKSLAQPSYLPPCEDYSNDEEAYHDEEALYIDHTWIAWKGTQREFGSRLLRLLKSIDLSSNNLSGNLPYEITSLHELVSLNISLNKLYGNVSEHIGQLKSLESLDLSWNMFSGNIPQSLSYIACLSYLNLSNNNFSGRIPSGTQLQGFDASVYSGNHRLCGPPLTPRCGLSAATVFRNKDDREDEADLWKSYYMGMCTGFVVGFWGICGALFLNRRCRHFFFGSLSRLKDWIFVASGCAFAENFKGSLGGER